MTTWTSQPLANAARRSGVNCVYAIKYATELVGKFDRKALADKLHGLTLDVAKYPNMLLATSWDNTGELSRESFITEVKDGKQVVTGTVPAN